MCFVFGAGAMKFPYLAGSPIAFAHRGGAALWPENTLVAFRGAVELGFRYLETDLRMTRDGVIVCFHDETLERTTNGSGRLRDRSIDELRALDAGYRYSRDGSSFPFRGRGITIPTLEEVLALGADLRVNVEIKQRDPPMEEQLWREIDRLEAHDRLLIAAAYDPLVRRFVSRRSTKRMPTSPGTRGVLRFWLGARTGLHRFERYSFQALQVPLSWRGIRVVDRGFVDAAHAHGLHVHVWTIDEPDLMGQLLDLRVDGIMTDRPDRLAAVFAERGLPLSP